MDLRKFRTAEEYNEYIKKGCTDYWEVLAVDAELDFYKEKERGNKKLVTKKELKDDLHKFVNFRKKDLYRCLKYLPVTYNREGIEELKMEFEDTLERYAFFQPVLKEICSKAFEANNISEQDVNEQKISPVEKGGKFETVTCEENHSRDKSSSSRSRKELVDIPDWTDL